ncbi:MAG: hypothetical protein COA45_08110 [Zetaproteobacteria bacterium]|nr:MAG: hypothetical protein COA45_08110 [Zetaproteobacteria bacterium]
MKIVFLGYDYTLDIAQRLIADGHEIIHMFTFPCDGIFSFNTQIKSFAAHFDIPISEQKITSSDIDKLIHQGCKIFLCSGYPYKIPEIDNEKAYGLNIHPTLLPRIRGIMPLPFVIMHEPESAGFTVHKLTTNFDAGDILYQEAIPIDKHTDVETLGARIAVRAPDAIAFIIKDIKNYWGNATPQDHEKASTYGIPDTKIRHLNWEDTAERLRLKGCAFGRFGVTATVTNNMNEAQTLAVFQFTTWKETHTHPAGTLLRSSAREIIISIQDGYACLKEFQVIES